MDNLIAVHKSTTMMPSAYSFAMISIDGETRIINSVDRDYIDRWDLPTVRSYVMGRQFGHVPLFLSSIHVPDPDGRFTRSLIALLLPHDVFIWPCIMPNKKPMALVYRFRQGLSKLDPNHTSFTPYWSHQPWITTDSPNVLISLWADEHRLYGIVSNLGDTRTIKLKIPSDKRKQFGSLIDFQTQKPLKIDSDGTIQLQIAKDDFRLITSSKP